jgi:sugar O-acyltransferase (sialic acid O-acetyltransferase NeuD family)
MPGGVLLIGAGALGRDVAATCAPGVLTAVFVEPGFEVRHPPDLPLVRDWEAARAHASHFILGLLDLPQRRRLQQAALAAGLEPAPGMASPSASVSPHAQLGPGCLVGNNVQVGAGTRLGRHVLLMHNAVVGHDVEIGDNCVVLPGAYVGGYTRIGADCLVGANSVTAPRVSVGAGSVLAPGAACLRDIGPDSVLIGNPGRVVRRPQPG